LNFYFFDLISFKASIEIKKVIEELIPNIHFSNKEVLVKKPM